MNSITDKVNNHDVKLARIEAVLERVAINQDKLIDSQTLLMASIGKMEIILEKFNHLETSTDESFKRVHDRVDNLDKKIEGLEVIIFFAKYPKLAFFTIIGLLLFAIKEVRDFIFGLLGV